MFQVLTKRAERMRDLRSDRLAFAAHVHPTISGGESVSKIDDMAYRVSHSSVLPLYRYVSRLSICHRPWSLATELFLVSFSTNSP
jgi:hypothetical protein